MFLRLSQLMGAEIFLFLTINLLMLLCTGAISVHLGAVLQFSHFVSSWASCDSYQVSADHSNSQALPEYIKC